MVSFGVMLGLSISLIICIALPVVPFIIMQAKKLRIGRAFLFGVLAFFISQIVLRFPLLQLIGQTFWFQTLTMNPVPYGLFLGITAGLFEEFARFLACGLLLRRNRRYVDAVAFGFGHGGIEAILLAGLPLLNSLIMIVALNKGTLDSLVGPAQAETIAKQLSALTPLMSSLGGVERILAVCTHLGLSILVFTGFVKNKPWRYLLIAILLHAVVDAAVVIVPAYVKMDALGLEAMVGVFALALLAWGLWAKRLFSQPESLPPEPAEESIEPDQIMEEGEQK
jgi:uncharacterized membrane protein YhfC